MDTTDSQELNGTSFRGESPHEQLNRLFGSYRAEALREELYELFSEPAYFRDLTTNHSCVLQGGRGTGKTTVLKSLSYQGHLTFAPGRPPSEWPFIGLYFRVNPNRTAAFSGGDLPESSWTRLFAHYFNLTIVLEVLRFLRWYDQHADRPLRTPADLWRLTSAALNVRECAGLEALLTETELAITRFEAHVNNISDQHDHKLSMQGAPIDALISGLRDLEPFRTPHFFLLIDEYEKLEDYQQKVVNTLIKQSGEHYCFKIAVRELGLRTHETLSPHEHLITPADYSLIDIETELDSERFQRFARQVCHQRLARISPGNMSVLREVELLLPDLSEEEEARLLGIEAHTARILDVVRSTNPGLAEELANRDPVEIYFVGYWSEASDQSLIDVATECIEQSQTWRDRLGNYQYAALFTIKRGKRGIRKYYSGWRTFTLLAAGNIRYLLQLVDRSLIAHLAEGGTLASAVPPETQTKVAQQVGLKALTDLSGLSVHGAQVTKLQLGLGRLFGQFAADPKGHTPEVNRFSIAPSDDLDATDRPLLHEVLRASVMDLALRQAPSTKPTDAGHTKEPEYWPHPIFSPYFVFSHRQKRRMAISEVELVGLLRHPRKTINAILARTSRTATTDDDLPEQLRFFEAFFSGTD